jgi:hypothetical protein
MKAIIIMLLFTGMFFILNGIYEQKLKVAEQTSKVEYRFIPRTYYEEQLSNNPDLGNKMADMFNHAAPWFDRVVGSGLDAMRNDDKGIKK